MLPSPTSTVEPPTVTATVRPPRFSADASSRLGRPIATPWSICHVNVPSVGSRSARQPASVAPPEPVAGSSSMPSPGANMRA